jgi:hypothetical protein
MPSSRAAGIVDTGYTHGDLPGIAAMGDGLAAAPTVVILDDRFLHR